MYYQKDLYKEEAIIKSVRFDNGSCRYDTFYFEFDNHKYHLSCVKEVYLNIKNNTYTMKDAILKEKIDMDTIIDILEEEESIRHFSFVYYRAKKASLNKFTIIECDNGNYYIGNAKLKYGNSFCR